ncbi:FG-GAP-like repeat-containing protein [Actinacidiphila acidipaludis]|uniref:FG-GAP-like repeat-containing protein n=1 Tax=Actinacidiphila acidipaludis TaxID=2873382 RepID=A0ABS7Q992_9ACTN|nr:FG-GAP-like repeat-containing protein [Streptomyces acidipaludis]MBY8879725.1 FG-GAP-like repeat-containing protein [Streptomyces acidipaludis]
MIRTTTAVRRGLVAALAVLAAATAELPQTAVADGGPPAGESVIAPVQPVGPGGPAVIGAAAHGYLTEDTWTADGSAQYAWQPDNGTVTTIADSPYGAPDVTQSGDGRTWVSQMVPATAPSTSPPSHMELRVFDVATATWATYPIVDGYDTERVVPTATGWALLAQATDARNGILHLLTPAGAGRFTDRAVSDWPADARWMSGQIAAVPGAVELTYNDGSHLHAGVIDTDTASLADSVLEAGEPAGSYHLLLDRDHFGYAAENTVRVYDRTDPQAPPAVLTVPGTPSWSVHIDTVLAGDAVIALRQSATLVDGTPDPAYSLPLDGGPVRTLLDDAATLLPSADGGAIVNARTGTESWATFRIPADGTGPVVLRPFSTFRPQPAGLSLARGRLTRVETAARPGFSAHLEFADVGTGAVPAPGASATEATMPGLQTGAMHDCAGGARCEILTDDGGADGPFYLTDYYGGDMVVTKDGGNHARLSSSHGHIVSVADDRVLYDSGSSNRQVVLDFRYNLPEVVVDRPITAAALWGATLWSATSTTGVLTSLDLGTTGAKPVSVTTDIPCVPAEMQVLGRWLYWSCGDDGPAGVWDGVAGRSVRVPVGHALLGDGFVVRHAGDQLVLTDVHTGTAQPDRTVAQLPAGPYPDDRNITWTLDKYRGFLAYGDAAGATHIVPSGVPESPLGVTRAPVSPLKGVGPLNWRPTWLMTGPVASWRVDLRRTGSTTVVKSFSGSVARDAISLTWDGRDSNGWLIGDGTYTWTLTATPDDTGLPASSSGTVNFDAVAHPRDYDEDGIGDLFAMTSAGRLDERVGTSSGGINSGPRGVLQFPVNTTVVPVGDLTKDGANDLLVRDAAGKLWLNSGVSATHTALIGAGWNIYDVLTSPGDLNGDGRPDLLARTPSGDLYLYAGTSTGKFAPRVKIGFGYQIYSAVVGVQDLTGDGAGDVLARDRSGVLWRYDADGRGGLRARVRIGAGWNVYNAVVGVGDLNGDGRSDLVARDGNGDLWRYSGLGNGQFAARVKIGWAWQAYKSLV